jgi:hypothetical protein
MKLHQVIALVKGRKARATQTFTLCHKINAAAVTGIVRTYEPKDEDGEVFPPENKPVPCRIESEVIPTLLESLIVYYDTVATQETGNCTAKGTVKVDDKIILENVPVTVMLFLEKQVVDLLTFTKQLPVLPADETWSWDATKNCWVSEIRTTTKTQKQPRVVVKYEATKEHPAQTEMFSEDKTIGQWNTIHLSGAVPVQTRDDIVKRLQKLQDALKVAREEANNEDIKTKVEFGKALFDYIF